MRSRGRAHFVESILELPHFIQVQNVPGAIHEIQNTASSFYLLASELG